MFDDSVHDHSLMQDPAFAAALRACGQSPVFLPCGLMVLYRRLMGVPFAMLPRVKPPPDLCAQVRAIGLQRVPLILSPETPVAIGTALRLAGPHQRAVLSLASDSGTMRARLHPKWRNQLVRAERSGLTLHHGPMPPDPAQPLLAMDHEQARRRGYANWPAALTAAFAAVAPRQTHLFTAHLRGEPVAHMLFLRHGRRATYHVGYISAAGKVACAHNLLLWQAMVVLAGDGVVDLDLGLIDPRTPGLSRFKQRSGARAVETGGTWLRWTPLGRPLRLGRFHDFLPSGTDQIQGKPP